MLVRRVSKNKRSGYSVLNGLSAFIVIYCEEVL